ncbi:MAG: winged helix-turn-helix domain-containing protein [Eubacteriales bacterium]|jgi:molybdate transport system regulatory protein
MRARCKSWIETDEGEKAFGEGPWRLLKKVEETGSLNQAAKRLNMSYTRAVDIMKRAESSLGFPLLIREKGGAGGGGSVITPEARAYMRKYERFWEETRLAVAQIYRDIFETADH